MHYFKTDKYTAKEVHFTATKVEITYVSGQTTFCFDLFGETKTIDDFVKNIEISIE